MNYIQTISMVLFQECRFGKSHVHPFFSTCSAAKVDCSENSFTLSDLKEKLNGIELYKILQQTSGIIIEEDQLVLRDSPQRVLKYFILEILLLYFTAGARKFKKVQAKKLVKSNKSKRFLVKLHFWHF